MKRLIASLIVSTLSLTIIKGCVVNGTRGGQQKEKNRASLLDQPSVSVDMLIAEVSSAPAEIASDLFTRIAESKLILEKQKRIELLDDAFRRASKAQKNVRLKVWAGAVDTRSGYLSASYDLQLDTLSLQSHAIRAMLDLNPQRARNLFTEIPNLKLTPLTCSEVLAYDVSDFYKTLKEVEQKSFTKKERLRGAHTAFISSYLEDLSSPAQLSPVINLLVDLQLPAAELTLYVNLLTASLKKISLDPRSFALSMRTGGLVASLQRLIEQCEHKNLPTHNLLSAIRSYIIDELTSTQCSDTLVKSNQRPGQSIFSNVNKWFADPINFDEIKPLKVEKAGRIMPFWTTSESAHLLKEVKQLRFGMQTTPLSIEERKTEDWHQNFDRVLGEIERWDGTTEDSPTDYFHEKCTLYKALFDMAPDEEMRVRSLLSLAQYLKSTSIAQESRIEWLLHANYLIDKSRAVKVEDRAEILRLFKNSANPTLQLYAQFSELSAPN